MSDILSKWEAEARTQGFKTLKYSRDDPYVSILSQRILNLIDLIRKKDESLKTLKYALTIDDPENELRYLPCIREALALTEDLK